MQNIQGLLAIALGEGISQIEDTRLLHLCRKFTHIVGIDGLALTNIG